MADNILINAPSVPGGQTVATDDIGGIQHELVKVEFGADGSATMVDAANPLPVTDAVAESALTSIAAEDFATQVTLAAVLAKISSDPATQTTLAAILAKIIAAPSTEAKQDAANALLTTIAAITQPLTDAQLRANAVPVTISGVGAVTIADGSDVAEGAIGDAIVAAGAAGTLSAKLRRISQGLEDLKTLISVLPLPTGASTSALQTTGNTSLGNIDTKTPALGQALAAGSTPVVLTAAEETILSAILTIADFDTKTGSLTETAPATDTASSGLNGRLQRIAQRLTSLITAVGSPFQAGGSIGNTSFASTVADAANVVEGALADAIVAAGATGSLSAKLRRATQGLEDLKSLIVLAAGTNLIGKVGIDQTTPGTTNAVKATNFPTTVDTNAGNVSASTPRVVIATDQATIPTTEVAPTTIFNGKTTVTTAGTRVTLAASQAIKSVTIKALSTNTGFIYVGNATVANTNGLQLLAGDSVSMDMANLNTVNIDSSVNGEGVTYIGIN